MVKKIYQASLLIVLSLIIFLISACGAVESDKYSNDYIRLTNINEQVENYNFYFTVENISNEDITVLTRVFLKTGGAVDSTAKKISKGGNYTFYCTSEAGKFFENPKGIVIIYNSQGNSVDTLSFEFDD